MIARHAPTAPRRAGGFSLIELLVVIMVIGVLATMITLSIGVTGGDREIEQEQDRLQALIELAAEEAILQGREIGIRFYPHRYEFSTETWETEEVEEVERTVASWALLADDPLLKPRTLDDEIEIELEIDDRAVLLEPYEERRETKRPSSESERDRGRKEDEEDAYQPQVFVFSSGDVTPFTLTLRRQFANRGLTFTVDAEGTIEAVRDDEL
jgi:general secretion pathway protein H